MPFAWNLLRIGLSFLALSSLGDEVQRNASIEDVEDYLESVNGIPAKNVVRDLFQDGKEQRHWHFISIVLAKDNRLLEPAATALDRKWKQFSRRHHLNLDQVIDLIQEIENPSKIKRKLAETELLSIGMRLSPSSLDRMLAIVANERASLISIRGRLSLDRIHRALKSELQTGAAARRYTSRGHLQSLSRALVTATGYGAAMLIKENKPSPNAIKRSKALWALYDKLSRKYTSAVPRKTHVELTELRQICKAHIKQIER